MSVETEKIFNKAMPKKRTGVAEKKLAAIQNKNVSLDPNRLMEKKKVSLDPKKLMKTNVSFDPRRIM